MKVKSIFDRTNSLLAILASVLLAFIALSLCYDITMRYLLGRTLPWLFEVSEYSLLWITFLGAAWLLRREGHVKMDLILNRLKPRTQAIVNIITSIVSALVCLLITWYSAKVTWHFFQTGSFLLSYLEAPKWPIMIIIPVGSFLLFIQFLRRTYGYLVRWRVP